MKGTSENDVGHSQFRDGVNMSDVCLKASGNGDLDLFC